MQKLAIIGNLGGDAVIRTPRAGGEQFLAFTVACNERYSDGSGNTHEKTTWYDCVYKHTKIGAFLKKGDKVYVEGKPEYRTYQDQTGNTQISITLSAKQIELLSPKKEE